MSGRALSRISSEVGLKGTLGIEERKDGFETYTDGSEPVFQDLKNGYSPPMPSFCNTSLHYFILYYTIYY